MSFFDVINPKEVNDDKLPNGAEIIRHEESAFSNNWTTGKSFDDLEEKMVDETVSAGIHFAFDFKLHPDGVKKLTAPGNQIQSNCCILQHNLVMYSYAYAINVLGENENQELMCQFRLLPVSYTYLYPTDVTRGGFPSPYKPNAPGLEDAKLIIGSLALDLQKQDDGSYACLTAISHESLGVYTANGVATLRVEMTVERGYFELESHVDLNVRKSHVPTNSQLILEKILKGEEVPKSDWVITVGDGSPHEFNVHGPVLADSSVALKAAISTHMSIGNVLAMVSHENRFILPTMKAEDMRVLLTFIYHRRYLLPNYDAVSRIGQLLTLLFRDELPAFFKSWEAELVKKLSELDRSECAKTVAECVKAMICVHSAPRGALLVAYNAALVVAADTWQIAEAKGKKKLKAERIKKEIGHDWELINSCVELIENFKLSVCGVEKWMYVH